MTMDIFSVGACALCAVVLGALIKRSNREFALLTAAAACIFILLSALDRLGPLLAQIEGLAEAGELYGQVLPPVLKAVGIALAGELVSRICKDAGESALAYTVELASKAAVLGVSLPLLLQVFEYLEEIVRM